ncbi:hypothetical protein P152DRAFT_476076 [Eremomyces bilateralis CBS 781.70]|uniref:Mitochondrial F1F0 ATP synthase subunit Atp18 n=1 Tax=Eremomyces bilateralis CBS 781.70 TaxID=1392243 RepID=A0A6G1FWE7_9PEZI|nr:uncharacterized protein P152DRAFT_476076 [Eremomyces bilateralis CBS 781.70]KAF1809949.1 hypothetical protein P152DRAFT_476076 [Eremomyces bilateralis CBS 781.70]
MSLLGRKWPAPIMKPMWPFYISGVVILYGVNSMATAMANTDEHRNDPRNHIVRNKTQAAH